jgi:hypothetical protein
MAAFFVLTQIANIQNPVQLSRDVNGAGSVHFSSHIPPFNVTVHLTICQGLHDAAYDVLTLVCQNLPSLHHHLCFIFLSRLSRSLSFFSQVFDLSSSSLGAMTMGPQS